MVGGLTPLTNYWLYCASVNSYGRSSFPAEVLSTQFAVTTVCCNDIIVSSAPPVVYGDPAMYASSGSGRPNLFRYSLTSLPQTSVTVSVKISNLDGSRASSIVSFPEKTNFSSTSTSSVGSFFLSSSGQLSGSFLVYLTVSGPSRADFSVPRPLPVKIISSSQPQAAPTLLYAQFSDGGSQVNVVFSTSTDQAGIVSHSWPCKSLFDFAGVGETECQWISQSVAQIQFLSNISSSAIGVHAPLNLRPNLIRAACSATAAICALNSATPATQVIVLAPANPVSPVVVINTPPQIADCDDIVLDASLTSGNGGRDWERVEWTVEAENDLFVSNAVLIQTFLKSKSDLSRPIVVSNILLNSTTFYFTLSVFSFLGSSNSLTFSVKVISDPRIPLVVLLGKSAVVSTASSSLSVYGNGYYSSCFVPDSSASLTYFWSIRDSESESALSVSSISSNPKLFLLSPYSLQIGRSYVVTLTVTNFNPLSPSDITFQSSSSKSVFIASGNVVALIAGSKKTFFLFVIPNYCNH